MHVTANQETSWLRRFHPSPDAGTVLVCFPHAGGSASYFHPMSAALAPATEVLAVQYPGRQDRRAEPFIDDLHVLADQVARVLEPWAERPMTFFGHSMGATVAHETALRLETRGIILRALFVSGRRSPTAPREEPVRRWDDASLLAEMRTLDGTESRALEDDELIAMILPAIRNDYRAIETYRYRHGPPLHCPIVALLGDGDPKVTVSEARAWRRLTTAEFDLRAFPGGHFYLDVHREAVLALLAGPRPGTARTA